MTLHTRHPWRRLAAVGLGLLAAAAIAGVVALALSVWAAAGIGVLLGLGVAAGLEAWDDRYFPDRVVLLAAGTQSAEQHDPEPVTCRSR